MLTRQMLTRQMLTGQMLTGQMLTCLYGKRHLLTMIIYIRDESGQVQNFLKS